MSIGRVGHPGKSGSLEQLFEVMFQGLPQIVLEQMVNNLDREIFAPAKFPLTTRRYKVADVEVMTRVFEFVRKLNNEVQANNPGQEGGDELHIVSSGLQPPEAFSGCKAP